jgi:hypothetical protein
MNCQGVFPRKTNMSYELMRVGQERKTPNQNKKIIIIILNNKYGGDTYHGVHFRERPGRASVAKENPHFRLGSQGLGCHGHAAADPQGAKHSGIQPRQGLPRVHYV